MEISVAKLGQIAANCYMILTDKAAVVIDPGQYSNKVSEFLKDNNNKKRIILLTHSHFDHICGAKSLREETGVNIAIGENDAEGLFNSQLNLSDMFCVSCSPFYADIVLTDNQEFIVGDITINCIETPGHTKGGMCYLCNNALFSGDTLFLESVGRTDFPGSDFNQLKNSLKRIVALDENTTVYPGHGDATTIKHEKTYNPFIKGVL